MSELLSSFKLSKTNNIRIDLYPHDKRDEYHLFTYSSVPISRIGPNKCIVYLHILHYVPIYTFIK